MRISDWSSDVCSSDLTANLAVTAFHHHAVIPMVEAFTAGRLLDVGEACRAVFEHHAGLQPFDHLVVDFPTHPHRVLAVHFIGRVHEAVGQFAVGGEQQQAGGVDVGTNDIYPPNGKTVVTGRGGS